MKIVKSSCSSKRKVRTCTFSPQVNIKNKRTAVQTEQDVNAAHSEAKLQDLINDIKSNIYTKVKAVATSPEFGFDQNEVDDYFFVEVSATEIGEDHHEAIRVEVRGEVSYEGLEDLMEALNPIIESYDSYAYFEPVEPGIIEAYVSVDQVDMSIYGATASPDHMFYDYHGKQFSVHDNSSEIGEDNIDDVYFLWKGNISQQAGAYNDADEDYVYAFIRGRGVIEYYKKGKYVATDHYTLRDEDDFEYAWEYMEIILQHICDRLIAYNKDVPDRMVYNSTDLEDVSAGDNPMSFRYKGRRIKLLTDGTGYAIYEKGEMIDYGFKSLEDAEGAIDEYDDIYQDDVQVYSDTAEDEEDLPMVDQEYDSAATSINSNKLPAIYKMINLEPGMVAVDFGGGKFDNAVEYIKDKGATLVVYDPYNRSAEHNKEVLRILHENGGADAAINSNVLNVIKEPEARKNVLENIARITKPGAPIYITVYEGKGNGQEGPTKSGYQLNRKTADYLEEIQEVFPDATRRGKLITAHNSGSIASSEDITAEYNIQFKRSVIDELRPLLVEKLESKYGIEFFVTDMFIEGDNMHIQVYGDDEYHGDIDIPVDYSFDIWDLLEDAFNKFQELFDGKSSSPVKSYTDVEEDISRYDKDIVSYRKIISKSVEDSDDFLTDYTMYEVVTEDGSVEYECYFGDNDIYGPWNGEGLDFSSENYDEAVEWYNSYESDEVESSESIEADTFSSLEDQYLSPPEHDDPVEHENSQELIEVELDQVITVDVDGDYEWDDDTYVWASPDGSNEEWRSEDGVYIDDKVGVVEHIDDLIIPNVPTRPGKYRVTGLAELIYDVSGIQEYRTNYGPDDYESDVDTDHAVVSFNFRKSSVENLKITPVRR